MPSCQVLLCKWMSVIILFVNDLSGDEFKSVEMCGCVDDSNDVDEYVDVDEVIYLYVVYVCYYRFVR